MNEKNPVNPAVTGPITPVSNLQYARPTGTRKPSAGDWILAFFGLVGALPFVFLGAAGVYQMYERGMLRSNIVEAALMSAFGLAVGAWACGMLSASFGDGSFPLSPSDSIGRAELSHAGLNQPDLPIFLGTFFLRQRCIITAGAVSYPAFRLPFSR